MARLSSSRQTKCAFASLLCACFASLIYGFVVVTDSQVAAQFLLYLFDALEVGALILGVIGRRHRYAWFGLGVAVFWVLFFSGVMIFGHYFVHI